VGTTHLTKRSKEAYKGSIRKTSLRTSRRSRYKKVRRELGREKKLLGKNHSPGQRGEISDEGEGEVAEG